MSTNELEQDTIILYYPDGTEDSLPFPVGTVEFFEKQAAKAGKPVEEFLVQDVLMPYVNESLEKISK